MNCEHSCPSNGAGNPPQFNRRAWLLGAGATAVGLAGAGLAHRWLRRPAPVFIARNQRYTGPLAQTIREGLLSVGFEPARVRGRRVLLKPNLVEPSRDAPHVVTHPAVVLAAVEVFRAWGADVAVGEAPGHVRDTEQALVESGLGEALRSDRVEFIDLNYAEVQRVPNRGRLSELKEFQFPTAVATADLIVSMPKLKSHHWVGITASMKNLYGTLPGLAYGWPKNVLHFAGIPQTVVDINASLPERIAIVDGILCMEGDGPIMGTPKPMGILAVGTNPTALDATLARIIGLDPTRVPYLDLAAGRLGPIDPGRIPQRGEPWEELVDPFEILDEPHLNVMRPG
jgi:uncharacterized protein (DUF362 family)